MQNSHNSSSNPPLTDRELVELEGYVNRNIEPEPEPDPEPEKHVRVMIRASIQKSSKKLSLDGIDEDPEYISNLILNNGAKASVNRSMYSLLEGSTINHESVFNRYEIPFFNTKINIKNNYNFGAIDFQKENNDTNSFSNNEESEQEEKTSDKLEVFLLRSFLLFF